MGLGNLCDFLAGRTGGRWSAKVSGFLLFKTNFRNDLMATSGLRSIISVRKPSALLALNSNLERYASGKSLSKRKELWTAYQTKECEMTIRMDSTKLFQSVQKLH